ncbi:HSF-type DNA-binding-domain-containing protein [Crucibulum laeve]|uniref:HSF-type DNA-binding-domain-containing protein n=1 Tax=Crucibulum laeve TaxID=68775 RepID=A0A5C3MG18_9AGAR|nr:HSF-type DNA-binding-domain-containing protein [Crucibulum laeve]
MADLYPPSYSSRPTHQSPHQSYQRHDSQQYSQVNGSSIAYPPQLVTSQHSGSSNGGSSDDNHDQPPSPSKTAEQPPKSEAKPQATFLTKLYALLERPENHHMIRWDPAGEHIIVERPEQLALHVLPSIYRQSRFASFSRQLNIYGFMRKVNLRNVDPAIDDPDASTWSHPTLNRHSPAEVVANFKRRVPPRLPKPRKRDAQESPSIPPPRSAIGMGPVPLTVPSSMGPSHKVGGSVGRARGFSAPGSFTPLSQGGAAGWGTSYPRSALPPLTVPSDPPHLSHNSMYNHSPHTLHPITPTDDSPSSAGFNSMPSYSSSNRDMMMSSSQYNSYPEQNNWSFSSNNGGSSSHNGSLSSLLNPSSGYSRPTPTINTSYSPFSSMPMHGEHSASSMSPDSRPNTGYSISSVSSLPYDDHIHHDYSRPNSSHHRPASPQRPQSSKSSYPSGSLSVRRARRHSQAMSPYPSPYDHAEQQRPSTSPQPVDDHQSSGIPRVRSMIQLPSVDPYNFNPSQAEFAYSAIPGAVGHSSSMESMNGDWSHRNVRPSTSTSSISAASHTSSSQANTPPVPDNYHGDTDINRFFNQSRPTSALFR